MDDLIEGVRNGRSRAIARLITQVENSEAAAETAVMQLHAYTGKAHVIGITGPPGAGKSTLVNELAKELRRRDKRVGIIAVDPSSPFTGGAILGDRVRMHDLAGDRGIFIRSLASRGNLGGLSQATTAVVKIFDAAGFDVVLVETVGAGQSEVDIAAAAHTTLVIEAPGMGDDIQSFKAGILEIADILVVNKADRPSAAQTVKSLEMMLHLGDGHTMRHHGRFVEETAVNQIAAPAQATWQVPVKQTVSTEGQGIPELVDAIETHYRFIRDSSEWQVRERERSRREMAEILHARLWQRVRDSVAELDREQLITAVANRDLDPYTAVNQLLQQIEK
ncbi:MAG: methylmalonyl Co-A mutase-associated GTPase MeaB [Anaerolineae bacterium]|nr:methylmalonyl Co-A mutase-associated GTPase MeaB [Anaerolineae bacterium]